MRRATKTRIARGVAACLVIIGATCFASAGSDWQLPWVGTMRGCEAIEANRSVPISGQESSCNRFRVVEALRPIILAQPHMAGRVYYESLCQPPDRLVVPFPVVKLRTRSPRSSGIMAIREVFRDEPHVGVTTEGQLFRVTIGDVPGAILRARIGRLSLSPYAQYNPEDAIQAILQHPDVAAAAERLSVGQGGSLADHLVQQPMEGVPHLPATMTNLTVDEALDRVAVTFDAIVLYGENDCSPARRFYVSYGSLRTD